MELSTDPMSPIKLMDNPDNSMAEKIESPEIESLLNKILMSDYFLQFWKNQERIDCNPDGLTGEQICAKLREPINLLVSYYDDDDTIVDGYEEEDEPTEVHINEIAMKANDFSIQDKASLVLHERSHCAGFFHDGNSAAGNEYTIPYLCNNAIDQWQSS